MGLINTHRALLANPQHSAESIANAMWSKLQSARAFADYTAAGEGAPVVARMGADDVRVRLEFGSPRQELLPLRQLVPAPLPPPVQSPPRAAAVQSPPRAALRPLPVQALVLEQPQIPDDLRAKRRRLLDEAKLKVKRSVLENVAGVPGADVGVGEALVMLGNDALSGQPDALPPAVLVIALHQARAAAGSGSGAGGRTGDAARQLIQLMR